MKEFSYYGRLNEHIMRSWIRNDVYNEYHFNPNDPNCIDDKQYQMLEDIVEGRYNQSLEKQQDLLNEFKHDLFEHFNISNHPKKDIMFRLALDQSDNFEEIYDTVERWVELIKD